LALFGLPAGWTSLNSTPGSSFYTITATGGSNNNWTVDIALNVTGFPTYPVFGQITGIDLSPTVGAPTVIHFTHPAAANPAAVGATVMFQNVSGTTQLNQGNVPTAATSADDGLINITAIGGSAGVYTVTLDIDSTGFGAWSATPTPGGIFFGCAPSPLTNTVPT